jgi:hypothetical protein
MLVRLGSALIVALLLALSAAWAQPANPEYDGRFVFTRVRHGAGWNRGGARWSHDYPRADEHLPRSLADLTTMRPRVDGSSVRELDAPEIFRHPVLYVSEPGY